MSDEIVVFNDVNIYTGMRALLVKRAIQPVEVGKWLEVVPEPMRGKVLFDEFEIEQGAFVWHYLRMDWMTREFIGFEIGDSRLAAIEGWEATVKVNGGEAVPAVGWTLESGERMSGAIRSAAELYWGTIGKYPQVTLVKSLPKDAPKTLKVDDSEIRLLVRDWMWRGMVVVL
jgi:hypothetical protein